MRQFQQLLALALLLLLPIVTLAADSGKQAFTDAKSAGEDYLLQGEYKGTVETDEGPKQFGGQVIALGDGKFQIVGYPGGLPGEGWNRGDESPKIDGESSGGKITFVFNEAPVEIDGKTISVKGNDGQEVAKLTKVMRESPTLGAEPPAGAKVLFDGTSADAFENGKLVDGEFLGATNCASKLKLGDHQLHIEFRTPFMPQARGQGRGNSGVYVQGRYEVQVLDSFGLEGKNNECGGIYSISEPAVNMCFPPLSWQTYDIDFTAAKYDDSGKKTKNARVTIKHNGITIHDDLELTHGTPGRHPEGPEPDALFLQNHGNPVVFRNIWVVQK
jgi:hypothetical protein